jgi:hypothetical protein
MSSKTDEQKLFEAQDAKYILDHPLTQNAFEQIRNFYVNQIVSLPLDSSGPEKDRLMMGLKNLQTLKNHFKECINTGKLIVKQQKG